MKLILTTLAKDKKSQVSKKRKEHKVKSERICNHIIKLMEAIPYNGIIKNPIKKAGMVGNYCQILRALTQLEHFENYDKILKILKKLTSYDYGKNIKARDFAEIVQAICTLHKHSPEDKLLQREMTLIT